MLVEASALHDVIRAAAYDIIRIIHPDRADQHRLLRLAEACEVSFVIPGEENLLNIHTFGSDDVVSLHVYGRAMMVHALPVLGNESICYQKPVLVFPELHKEMVDASTLMHEITHLFGEGDWKPCGQLSVSHKSGARFLQGSWDTNTGILNLHSSEQDSDESLNELLTDYVASILQPRIGLGKHRCCRKVKFEAFRQQLQAYQQATGLSDQKLLHSYFTDSQPALEALCAVLRSLSLVPA